MSHMRGCVVCVVCCACAMDGNHLLFTTSAAVSFYVVVLNEFGLATAAFSLRADSAQKAKSFQAQVESAQVGCQPCLVERFIIT